MEMTEMQQLVDLVKRFNIRELTVRNGESRVTLKKSVLDSIDRGAGSLVPYQTPDELAFAGTDEVVYAYADGVAVAEVAERIEAVTAPLVGIFHHVKPLIGPGTHVSAGQVVAVIEAMKLITEVTSPADGVVLETVIKDGMPAEYGQPLFLIKLEQ